MTAPPPSDQSPAQPGYTPLPQETARDRDSIASDDSDLDPRRYRLSTLQSQGFDEQPSFLPEVHDHVRPPSYFNNMRPSHESLTQPRQSTTNNPPDEFANQAQGSYFAAMSPPGPQPAHLPTDSRSPDSVELRELDRVAPPPTYPPVADYPDYIAATAGPSSHLVPGDNASEHARAKKSTDSIGSRLVRKFSSRSRASSRVQEEGGMSSRSLRRQRSLVRPERARRPKVGDPNYHSSLRGNVNTPAGPQSEVRNRRTVLTRENTLSRGRALGRKSTTKSMGGAEPAKKHSCPRPWIIWCYIATFYAPGSLLRCCGMPNPAVQLAWREKMGLVTIIMFIMACVGFLTFGFQQVVCGLSTSKQHYIKYNEISSKDVIINGRLYDVSEYAHPASSQTGDNVTPGNLRMEPVFAGAMDLSFLFQYPNGNCKGLFNIPEPDDANGNVVNFFPCVINNGTLSPDPNLNPDRSACHTTSSSRKVLSKLPYSGDQYYDWETIKGVMRKRKFVIYNGSVMDMGRLDWLVKGITPIGIFNELAQPKFQGRDVTWYIGNNRPEVGKCLEEMFRVGALDTNTIGCMASQIVLYVSLIVILGVVFIKFGLAVIFGWVMGPRLGLLKDETPEERRRRIQAIELWSDVNNHYGQPMTIRPQYSVATNNKRSRFFPRTSRFSTYMPGEEPGRAPRATNYSSVYGGIPARSQRASNFANLTANSSCHSLVFPPMPGAGIETSSPAVG
ncbi:Chitin synthase, class 3, partial [Dimargaris xerosporica]